MRGGRGCRFAQTKAFPWRGRCHAKSVTDEVEGSNFVPTHGDKRSLRPHQSALAGCQLPLQGKPFLRSTGPVPPAGACPSRGGAKQDVQRILHRNLKFDAESENFRILQFTFWQNGRKTSKFSGGQNIEIFPVMCYSISINGRKDRKPWKIYRF